MSTNGTTDSGASTGTVTTALPSFDNSLGPILLGAFASFFLYGITCLQTFIYVRRYPLDPKPLKLLVYALLALDSFDVALTAHVAYHYLVSNYANPLAIEVPVWSIKTHVLITSISDFIVRGMFARRVHRLSRGNWFMTGGIVAISIVDLVVGTIITARAFGISTFDGLSAVQNLFYLNFASNLSADLYVALVLTFYLWTSRTGFGRTDSVLVTLIMYTVNTGMLTALDAAAGMICYAVMPTNLVFIGFYLNLSKLYVNCYLASLNARASLLTSMKSSENGVSIHLSRVSRSMPSFRQGTPANASANGRTTKERSFGTGLDTFNPPTSMTTEDTLRRTRSDISQKEDHVILGLGDKDSGVYRDVHDFDGDADALEIKVETTIHSDVAGVRGGEDKGEEVEVTLPRMRYGYPQVETPDAFGRHPHPYATDGKSRYDHGF